MTNFTIVQNEILKLKLSGQAFKLYCILKSYCFNNKTTCFPSQKTLSERLNKSVRTVQRAIKELVEAGLIKIKRRGSISNVYELRMLSMEPNNTAKKDNISIHHEVNSLLESYNKNSKKREIDFFSLSNTYKKSGNWNKKKDAFNNFEQRNYNFDKLESILLRHYPAPESLSEILE
ncbi:winged helix-turn-helix transcriptional regulator [Clostridium bovifaecis]|uniref:Winged helix-turn-helix transcriptional regulator n=1 Tax=Clostridium bovifaecis TaxID=2184719 RepID=A0A6I6ESW0_9CLOT|nr:winged helix-turn-helix transcriptional regulator [Clostridium bovifaecis]